MNDGPVIVVGSGVAGLVSAIELASRGLDVTVLERAATPGGKLRQVLVGETPVDAGPTVFTMRWVFDELFEAVGTTLDAHVELERAEILARHAWEDGGRLDLFDDFSRSVDAIGAFAGSSEAASFRDFSAQAAKTYQALERPFLRRPPGGVMDLLRHAGPGGLAGLWAASPLSILSKELARFFRDPRLRQLFGRYATYCGSSPYEAPAVLMLIAHVEREGVWLVKGGMFQLTTALVALAERLGVRFRYDADVAEISASERSVNGVRLVSGEQIGGSAVVVNADAAAVSAGLFGKAAATSIRPIAPAERSLSAITWAAVAETAGLPLSRHNVFFSRDYQAEFDDLIRHRRLPDAPTVYICAQDRGADDVTGAGGPERLLVLVNAPPTGDAHPFTAAEVESCGQRISKLLENCALQLKPGPIADTVTTPADFNQLFPGTGGALYGQASRGWRASFQRPGSRTRIQGLYLAGGSTHPGPGVPMAALSGRLAAASVLADFASMRRSVKTGISGGMSTRSATTGSMASS